MHVLFFGTFDERTHPRVRALREGIERHGHPVEVLDVPLGLGTSDRLRMAQRPWRAPILLLRLARCWRGLWRDGAGRSPDVVVVGYLGHFDVHLARRRFPRSTIVLDHMVSLGDTVRDRGIGDRALVSRLLNRIDRAALGAADVVIVDTVEQGTMLPMQPARLCVVPVAPPHAWFATTPAPAPGPADPVRFVFFGLFTPLQGAPVLAAALAAMPASTPFDATVIGSGQDLAEARHLAGADPRITWTDWVDGERLPDEVASHHVCLGIFGTSPKAQRVVPNKVLQGAATGCAIVTSDTPSQRDALEGAADLVPPGAVEDLTRALVRLATDRTHLDALRKRARARMRERFTPEAAIEPLLEILGAQPRSARVNP